MIDLPALPRPQFIADDIVIITADLIVLIFFFLHDQGHDSLLVLMIVFYMTRGMAIC